MHRMHNTLGELLSMASAVHMRVSDAGPSQAWSAYLAARHIFCIEIAVDCGGRSGSHCTSKSIVS